MLSGTRAVRRSPLRVERLEDRTTPATLPAGFTEAAVAAGIQEATAMEVAPNGDLWVIEQGGAVKRFAPGSTTADVVADVSALGLDNEGERGLLGITFSPTFSTDHQVFLYYTSTAAPTPHNRISRFTVDTSDPADYKLVDTAANPAVDDETVILDLDPLSAATNHNGGAIHFGPDGKLYVAVGENANPSNSQSLANRLGKMLRLNADGSIPADNPTSFPGIAGTPTGANRAIYAVGLRNPFTFTFQPGTGRLFINDVGQGAFEEINDGKAGANYGWPTTEGDFDPAAFPNFTRPFYSYAHAPGNLTGFVITGGAFYNPANNQFPAEFAGNYFFADFGNGWIDVIDPATRAVRPFATGIVNPVDLHVTADGSLLYLARDPGQVFRITYPASFAPAVTQQPANALASVGRDATFTVAASGLAPLAYRWQQLAGTTWADLADGPDFRGTGTATLTVVGAAAGDAGQYRVVVTNSSGMATSTPATLTVTANQPPAASIAVTSGLTNGVFVAGQPVAFTGAATDPQDGPLGASAFTFTVEYVTSIGSGNPVVRPFVPAFGNQTGGAFTPATTGPYTLTDVTYRITLTVRDSVGLTTTVTRDIAPAVSTVTLASNPTGLTLTLDGQPMTAPVTFRSVVGFEHAIGAANQTLNGTVYGFQSWSDGGAATHTVSTPAADTTYTATFVAIPPANLPIGPPTASPPAVPPGSNRVVTSGRAGGTVQAFTLDAAGNATPAGDAVTPFPGFSGVVRAVVADVNGDGTADTVYGVGPGGGSLVRVVDGKTGQDLVAATAVYEAAFTGGVFLATADVDGDGTDEVIVSPDQGGGGRVRMLKVVDGAFAPLADFFGIDDTAFRGGARVAVGDVNGDGRPDLLVGAGFGGGPRVAMFDGAQLLGNGQRPKLIGDFFAFPGADATTLRNGVFLAAGDFDGDGKADAAFGGGPGGGPRVFVLSGALLAADRVPDAQAAPVANFFAADASQRGGVRLAAKNFDGDRRADLLAGSGSGLPGSVTAYPGTTLTGDHPTGTSFTPFADTTSNGVFVG